VKVRLGMFGSGTVCAVVGRGRIRITSQKSKN
jgi:hypothetical protein